jgi:VWFA-related protein
MIRVVLALLLAGALGAGEMQPAAAPQQAAQGGSAQDGGAGQEPAPQPAQPATFRGEIDFIRVDAFVRDRNGRPVTDLEETDFELIEDGKPQKIEQFRAISIEGTTVPAEERVTRISSASDEEREARRDDVRLFVFFLDDYHVRDRNAVTVRAHLTTFIESQLRPVDMLAVMYPLTPTPDVVFTRNHQSIINAIQRFEGRKYNYAPRNGVEREVERLPTQAIEKIRNQIVYSAIEALTYRLAGLRDSRKSVIFVSEGFTLLLPPQMRRADASAPQPLGSATPLANESELELQEQMELDSRMRDVYKAANRNNTAFYPLDPRGLAVFEYDIIDGGAGLPVVDPGTDARTLRSTQETLRTLATETGGRAIINRNTLVEGLAEMVRDSSHYYLLGYTSPAPNDGKFHEIRVRVKRPGVDVQARKGFWTYTAEDIKRMKTPAPTVSKPVQQALASIASPVLAARFVRMWIGTERGENNKTRVTLVWESLPIQPNVRQERAGRLSLLAVDGQGDLVFRGRSPDAAGAPDPSAAAAATSSAPQRLVFDAPPGKLDMSIRIEAAAGGTLDDETRTIDVPDLTSAQARMSTPKVFRSRNAREFQGIASNAAAVPVASREFSRAERLLIRFDAYMPGSEKAAPTAALLNRSGQKFSDLVVGAAAAGGTHQIDLGLNTIPAGEYLVEITLEDATGVEAKELVAFRVGA